MINQPGLWTAIINLDRQVELTGTYSGGNTTWTLPIPDETLDCIVLGEQFGSQAGDIKTPDSVNGATVTLAGDWSAGPVVIGRKYILTAKMTRPYIRDRRGFADADAWLQIREVTTYHHLTGAYQLRTVMPRRGDRVKEFEQDTLDDRGTYKARFNGNAQDMQIWIESDSPKPCTITGVEFIVDYASRNG
jgi:hypothetical protein